MISEQFPEDTWDDFDSTADMPPIIELVPDLTTELIAPLTDNPDERVLWPPTDEAWADGAEHTEATPNEYQQRMMGAFAIVAAFERGSAPVPSERDRSHTKEMLQHLGCLESEDEFVAEALLARQAAYELCGESALFAHAAEIYEQYIATFPTKQAQRNDMKRVNREDLSQNDTLAELLEYGVTAVTRNPLRIQNLLRVMSATVAQINHFKELNQITDELADETLFDQLATKSPVDSKYDIAADSLQLVRKYSTDELISLPIESIMDENGHVIPPREATEHDDDYEKPVEPDPTELFTLMCSVIDARTKADAQISSLNFRLAELRAEQMLLNMGYDETPKNVLLVHRAQLAAFVIAGVAHSNLQPVRSAFDSIGMGKSTWPDMVERIKKYVQSSAELTNKIEACLPFLIDTPNEKDLAGTTIVVTLQQIQHWKQERSRSEASQE